MASLFQGIKGFFKRLFRKDSCRKPTSISSLDSAASSEHGEEKSLEVTVSNYPHSMTTEEEENIYNNDPTIRHAFKKRKQEKQRNPHVFISSSEPTISQSQLPKDQNQIGSFTHF